MQIPEISAGGVSKFVIAGYGAIAARHEHGLITYHGLAKGGNSARFPVLVIYQGIADESIDYKIYRCGILRIIPTDIVLRRKYYISKHK